ncbi:hypothetical protein BaRGS_00027958, partial [Batillaria attramentaria]
TPTTPDLHDVTRKIFPQNPTETRRLLGQKTSPSSGPADDNTAGVCGALCWPPLLRAFLSSTERFLSLLGRRTAGAEHE